MLVTQHVEMQHMVEREAQLKCVQKKERNRNEALATEEANQHKEEEGKQSEGRAEEDACRSLMYNK